jgi:YhcG PDDEXK nuclease domain
LAKVLPLSADNIGLLWEIFIKKEKAGYEDVGQMNMYLGYFENEENTEDDNPPIGIVLAKEKDELLVKYAMHNISSQLFISKYQLYLPNKEELQHLIEKQLQNEVEQQFSEIL